MSKRAATAAVRALIAFLFIGLLLIAVHVLSEAVNERCREGCLLDEAEVTGLLKDYNPAVFGQCHSAQRFLGREVTVMPAEYPQQGSPACLNDVHP